MIRHIVMWKFREGEAENREKNGRWKNEKSY